MEYLLKASAVIIIFYICYKLFLQRETFFEYNRWFLFIGILIAIGLPFIVIPIYIEYVPVIQNFMIPSDAIEAQTTIASSFNWMQIIYTLYCIGTLFFLIKLGIEFYSLLILLNNNKTHKKGKYSFIETDNNVPPFSFSKYIVYNRNQFCETELVHIINHEKVHANQYHSIDILLIQLATTVFWFNPFIWLYKKEIQQNLEFIADMKAQTISSCEKSYQTLLLKASLPDYQLALANNFYNSLIKKRIVMLHKSKSNKLNVWKYALTLPVLAIFLISANTKKIYIEKAASVDKSTVLADPSVENEFNNLLNSSEKMDLVSEPSREAKKLIGNTNQTKEDSSIKGQDPKAPKASVNDEMVVISKDFTDGDLESIKKQLSEKGITVKIKGVKRNNKSEITAIKIDVSSKNSNANYRTESDEPIKPIKINIDDDQISIGNSDYLHFGDHAFGYLSKDGEYKTHMAPKADNVFVFSGDGENVVIRNSDKVHSSPKAKAQIHFFSEDGDESTIEGESVIIREHHSGDVDTIQIKKLHKGKAVWVDKGNDDNVFKIKNKSVIVHSTDTDTFFGKLAPKGKTLWTSKEGDNDVIAIGKGNENAFFISTGDGEEPMYYLNGKEISKKEMNTLEPNSIEKVEILKGDSAIEKYGDKGKNGVVLITTKDKK